MDVMQFSVYAPRDLGEAVRNESIRTKKTMSDVIVEKVRLGMNAWPLCLPDLSPERIADIKEQLIAMKKTHPDVLKQVYRILTSRAQKRWMAANPEKAKARTEKAKARLFKAVEAARIRAAERRAEAEREAKKQNLAEAIELLREMGLLSIVSEGNVVRPNGPTP